MFSNNGGSAEMLIPYVVIGHNSTEESLNSNKDQRVHEPYDRIVMPYRKYTA
jgi:hypothetical protein